MAGNKKPRKKYRPRTELRTPGYFAKLPTDIVFSAEMIVTQAMYALTHGAGVLNDWQSVCTALNLGLALDEQNYAAAHAGVFREAMLAHRECGRRAFGYSGAEMAAVNAALAIHYEQIGRMTQRELDLAMEEIARHNRKQSGRERITVKGKAVAIETDAQYKAALAEAERLFDGPDPDPDSAEGRRLEELTSDIEAWEREHHPIGEEPCPPPPTMSNPKSR